MTFLDNNERDSRLVVDLELHAGLTYSTQLVRKDVRELPLADAVAVKYDACRLETGRPVELD